MDFSHCITVIGKGEMTLRIWPPFFARLFFVHFPGKQRKWGTDIWREGGEGEGRGVTGGLSERQIE